MAVGSQNEGLLECLGSGSNCNQVQENGNHPTVRIGNWNTEWRRPNSQKGTVIGERLAAANCDILCITEGYAGILPSVGHVIDAGQDWGYPIVEARRKVLLWSQRPWTPHSRALGSAELPQGRFVAATTETASGECLTVIGVCIPWRHAHVNTGTKDRKPWQDHEAWLAGFERLRYRFPESRTVVLGDFNQKIPRTWAPHRVYKSLEQAFKTFEFATAGHQPGDLRAIDHIAHTPDLTPLCVEIWPKKCTDGTKLSNHFGVWCDFNLG